MGGPERILVAGGAGFIGSNLIDALIRRGHHIVCVDDLTSGRLENIRHLEGEPRFTLIRQDVCVPLDVEVDEIYNLASPASPVRYNRDQIQTAKTNLLGSLNLLELATRTSLHQRNLWRSIRAPAARNLLGQRQSRGSALLLR